MGKTLDSAKMPTLSDKHRHQEEHKIEEEKKTARKKEEDSKGRTLETKTKKDGKNKGK